MRWSLDHGQGRAHGPEGNLEMEDAANAGTALDTDRAAHAGDKLPADRQPEAGAAKPPRDGGIDLRKIGEQVFQIAGRNADAGIGNPHTKSLAHVI